MGINHPRPAGGGGGKTGRKILMTRQDEHSAKQAGVWHRALLLIPPPKNFVLGSPITASTL